MTDNRILAFFPEEIVQLNLEVTHHPELQELLNNHPVDEFEIRMAEIAAYCDIILDGYYTGEDFIKLAEICTKRLRIKRGAVDIIVIQNPFTDTKH